jgi:hypothetical protein
METLTGAFRVAGQRGEGRPLGKWSEILGFGSKGRDERISSDDARKAARIRETMRWRGYDLTPYTDAEIVAVSDRLGGGVSETGETTEASRGALLAALRQMRASGEVVERLPRTEQDRPPAAEASPRPEPVDETPEPVSPAPKGPEVVPSAEPSRVARTPSFGEPDDRTALVRFRHVFGIHSWRPAAGPDGIYLRCPGCHQERPLAAGPRPLAFDREDRDEPMTSTMPAEPEERPEPAVEDEWRIPPPLDSAPRQGQPEQDTMPVFVRWLLGSPWWIKMLAIFAIVQIAGVIASVVRSI